MTTSFNFFICIVNQLNRAGLPCVHCFSISVFHTAIIQNILHYKNYFEIKKRRSITAPPPGKKLNRKLKHIQGRKAPVKFTRRLVVTLSGFRLVIKCTEIIYFTSLTDLNPPAAFISPAYAFITG